MNIHGHTTISGLIGYPIAHSLSYALHNTALKALHIDACYVPLIASDHSALTSLVAAMRTPSFVGANVTTPHKETIIPLLDAIDETAQHIGAVNTIIKTSSGDLMGKNSDAEGFLVSLNEANISYPLRDLFLIGAGGAARAVAMMMAPHVSSITISNRTPAKALQLIDDIKSRLGNRDIPLYFCPDPQRYTANHRTIIVQCTSLGRNGELPPHPPLDESCTVIDLLYSHTPLLQKAKTIGAQIQNGSSMLLHQAALSFSWWFSVPPPIDIMRSSLFQKRNIV